MLRTMYLVCLLALPVAIVPAGSAGAQGTPEARQACTPDAMRLCSDFIPDVPKITKCMIRKYAQLSRPCRLAMSRGHTSRRHYAKRIHRRCTGWPCT
jgi:hypothetical protein